MNIDMSDQKEVHDSRVSTFGIIINEISAIEFSQSVDNTIDDLVHPDYFADDGLQLGKERMLGIGRIIDNSAKLKRIEQPCLRELVELFSDRVGRDTKLGSQSAQIGTGFGV
jgi:hypothetical protein